MKKLSLYKLYNILFILSFIMWFFIYKKLLVW